VNAVVEILEAAGLQEQQQVHQPTNSGPASRGDSHSHVRAAYARRF
jgi:hypothetical protein